MLTLVGLNHRSAPLDVRERLALDEASTRRALNTLRRDPKVDEAFVLSTCNRAEFLVRTNRFEEGDVIERFLREEYGFDSAALERHTYRFKARDAIRHLFRVTSGLDSMILGEPQIHGQVKDAFRLSREAGATGVILDRLLQHALSAAKRARRETGISRHSVSVASAAVQLADKIFGRLDDCSVLMLGAGKMGQLVAKHLQRHGVADLVVCGRRYSRADKTARGFGGRAVHWDEGLQRLARVDIVIGCTGASHPVLSKERVQRATRRRARPLFLIDIAVPRDIEPEVHGLQNVYLYDIDALEGVVDENLGERRRAAKSADEVIELEVDAFDRWRQKQAVSPLIQALRKTFFATGDQELERFRRRIGPLTEGQDQALQEMTRALARKFLDKPTRFLRDAADRGQAADVARLFRDVFELERDEQDATNETDETTRKGPRLIEGGRDGG